MYTGIGHSLGTDYFRIADQLTREELSYLERTHAGLRREADRRQGVAARGVAGRDRVVRRAGT